jgi:hypothetical protein
MLTRENTRSRRSVGAKLSGESTSDSGGPDTETRPPAGASTGGNPAVSYSIPPPERPHTWAELLTLVGAIRRIAYDVTLEAGDAMRRIRDAFADYDRT